MKQTTLSKLGASIGTAALGARGRQRLPPLLTESCSLRVAILVDAVAAEIGEVHRFGLPSEPQAQPRDSRVVARVHDVSGDKERVATISQLEDVLRFEIQCQKK